MKKLALAAILTILAGCAHAYGTTGVSYNGRGYRFHENTVYIKVYWNIARPGKDTAVAEGFVEPFSPGEGIHTVRLTLVGLDDQGRVVSSADGVPRDNYIESPYYPASPFKITLKLTGKEKALTIRGSYYHYGLGRGSRLERFDFFP